MLYEYNGKIYIRPFSNKLVEVEILKKGTEYDVKSTKKTVVITSEIKSKMTETSLEMAYKKLNSKKIDKSSIGTI